MQCYYLCTKARAPNLNVVMIAVSACLRQSENCLHTTAESIPKMDLSYCYFRKSM